ncbi:biotin/lipoyl-binding protein [Methylorubrum extorquens]|jgi:membrane fusion protein (multidrug efflux system)|uniref:Multidrug resistance protein MdtA-like barrel-sandwich hybrid domain-containing protein n=3 Tax=Methylorubrum extorquens TaxID=408 RepID=C5AZV2_METEA|nr:biotin/lipoyl-binding protein [Methylorubrum extorquens]ACS41476.1 conserved hypothetical protein [Methylorubrum extorquens AM1]MCP1540334.1 multidrug efflux pump subunit AcrA (membrane-fusion protein) [Methylorubrum extorquens]MCP1587129.1 multidrug efflux pump subunit AcrA (membrane-fusion protein) [Methylorubrum extorquens]CAX26144.1 protein of unknown function [Methylorubrum extorquens DM4]
MLDRSRTIRTRRGRALVFAAVLLAGTGPATTAFAGDAAAAPEVGIVTVEPRPVTLIKELPGRVTPMRIAEVRPRVSGIIVERAFQQGSVVKKGEVLYRIDPLPFEVELESAKALTPSRRPGPPPRPGDRLCPGERLMRPGPPSACWPLS